MPKALAAPSKSPEEAGGEPPMVELPEGMAEPVLLVEDGPAAAAGASALEQMPPVSAGGSLYSSPWLSRVDLQMLLVMP